MGSANGTTGGLCKIDWAALLEDDGNKRIPVPLSKIRAYIDENTEIHHKTEPWLECRYFGIINSINKPKPNTLAFNYISRYVKGTTMCYANAIPSSLSIRHVTINIIQKDRNSFMITIMQFNHR